MKPCLLEELKQVLYAGTGTTRTVNVELLTAVADAFARAVDDRATALARVHHLEQQQQGWVAYINGLITAGKVKDDVHSEG